MEFSGGAVQITRQPEDNDEAAKWGEGISEWGKHVRYQQ